MSDDTELRLRLSVMAVDSGLAHVFDMWHGKGEKSRGIDELIKFAKLVAEDCAGLCQGKCWPNSYEASEYGEPEHPTDGAIAIAEKYGIDSNSKAG